MEKLSKKRIIKLLILLVLLLLLFIFFKFSAVSILLNKYRYPFPRKGICSVPFPSWCDSVISTPCQTRMHPAAHYHKLVDCLIPEYATLKQAVKDFGNSTCVAGCGKRCVYLELLRLLNQSKKETRFFEEQSAYCLDSRPHINIAELEKPGIHELKRSALQLRIDIPSAFRTGSSMYNVLIVSRHDTRSFASTTLRTLMGSIRSVVQPYGGIVDLYHGNETVKKTMSLFHNAAAVVMFHGAAAGNMIFCRKHTIFFEISTYADAASRVKWRSNKKTLIPIRPDLVPIVHYIPVHDIVAEATIHALEESENKDQFVKSFRNITLTDEFCTRIAVELRAALRCIHSNTLRKKMKCATGNLEQYETRQVLVKKLEEKGGDIL